MSSDGLNLTFRQAQREDCALVLEFVHALAKYERLEHEVAATAELFEEWLFDKHAAEVFFAVVDGKEVGFTLFFTNFSTFLGRGGMYLEDIFVLPEYRNRGIGKAIFRELARICVVRGYGRLDWACLDWNTPSIDFYLSMGAKPLDDWTIYRLQDDNISAVAEQQPTSS